jgi:hypothetical protein
MEPAPPPPPAAVATALPNGLPYGAIKLIFTDLDGTLYPGDHHEDEPKADKPGLMRNMAVTTLLESQGVPVVPATGNNVGFAQKKMLDPATGSKLRDLSTMPGIYCNGALVKGAGGKEVDVRHLGAFIPDFVARWLAPDTCPPRRADICIVGLAKEKTLLMNWDGLSAVGRRTANEFTTQMMIEEPDFVWLEPDAFAAEAENVLSFLILFPNDPGAEAAEQQLKLDTQSWLHESNMLQFDDAATRLSNGEGEGVVCKHVHVPGLGPEIDISPSGVNKVRLDPTLLFSNSHNLRRVVGCDGGLHIHTAVIIRYDAFAHAGLCNHETLRYEHGASRGRGERQ